MSLRHVLSVLQHSTAMYVNASISFINFIPILLSGISPLIHATMLSITCWSIVWKTSVMPYVKPSANKKLQIWMTDEGGSIIFSPCTCWIFKKNSGWDPSLSYPGGSIIFWPWTCWIFKKLLGEILVCHTWGVNHLLTMHMLNL